MDRVRLEKMLSANPVMIVGNPALESETGLPAIDCMQDPIRPFKQHKIGNTIEAKNARMQKMGTKELAAYFNYIQKPQTLRHNA
jgi:hypothetical protein